jgi:hypothetical protein
MHIDPRRRNRDRRRAAARAEAGASVLSVMARWSAMLMRGRMRHVVGRLDGDGMVTVLGARVEGARIKECNLEPECPDGRESAEPRSAAHDLETISSAPRLGR